MRSKFTSPARLNSFDDGQWHLFVLRRDLWRRISAWASLHSVTLPRPFGSILRYAGGLAIILLVTLFYSREVAVSTTTVGFTFLLVILSASTIWGLGVSCAMSVAATLAFDYFFLPPIGTLNIANPQDWVALFSFLVTSVLGSSLSARAHSRALEANRRRQEVEQLYALSQRLMGEGDVIELSPAIPRYILESFVAESAALYLSSKQEVCQAGSELPQLDESLLRLATTWKQVRADGHTNIWFAPLRSGMKVIGSVGISGRPVSEATMAPWGVWSQQRSNVPARSSMQQRWRLRGRVNNSSQ